MEVTKSNEFFAGFHLQVINNYFKKTIESGSKFGANTFQIFLRNAQNPNNNIILRSNFRVDAALTKRYLQEHNLKLFIHSPYYINFAKEPSNNDWIRTILAEELMIADRLGAIGCVIHMGKLNTKRKKYTHEQGLTNMTRSLELMLKETKETKAKIILETSAGQGSEICYKLPELAKIYHDISCPGIDKESRIGFCIDTCHIFAAGYNIKTKEGARQYFSDFDRLIGLKNVSLVHLNDSKKDLNCRVDRHEAIGEGCIGREGLIEVCILCKKHGIPLVLETPGDTYEQLVMIKKYMSSI